MLGLYTFFYGVLHLMTWVWFDQFFDLSDMGRDLAKRPFIAMGMVAFVSMVPLAATSTQSMIRRLGRRWAVLHRLIYLTAVAAILHYLWHKAGKNDFTQVSVYAAVIAVLLATRLIPRRRAGPTAPTPSRAA
jgi:sulfoxide reductase heme-binding subunit YedZ